MKCMIPGQNVKILARALHSLARVGDELFLDPLCDRLVICTVNSSQSAFAEFVFHQSFFSSYDIEVDSPELLPKCKISMKSCMSVFKSPHSMDKMVDWCQLRLEPAAVRLIFKVKFTGGSTKTYFIPIIETETIQIKYKKSENVKLIATSKLLSSVVKNFRFNEDEITLAVTRQKATFRNHIDTCSEKNKMVRTELGLLAGEFEKFAVIQPVSLTFCLKQLRAVVAFAEPAGLPVNIYFEIPGRPVLFTACHEAVYEANFVVSTLTTVGESQSQETQKSDASLSSSSLSRRRKEESNSKNKSTHSEVVCSVNGNKMKESVMNSGFRNGVSRKRHRDSDEDDCNTEHNNKSANKNTVNNINCNSDSSVFKSVVSNSSTQDTVIIQNDAMNVDVENTQNSLQDTRKNIVSSVFSRCLNSTFQKNLLPGFNNIICYDSDGLEDSD